MPLGVSMGNLQVSGYGLFSFFPCVWDLRGKGSLWILKRNLYFLNTKAFACMQNLH